MNGEEGAMSSRRKESIADPVVAELLRIGAVESATVDGRNDPTWRDLAATPGADRERIYAEAARLAGIEQQVVDAWSPPDDLVRSMLGLFDEDIALQALRSGLLPVEIITDPNMADFTVAFATHDPLRKSLRVLFSDRGVEVVLRYAPESVVRERILATGIIREDELIRWPDHEDAQAEQHTSPDVSGDSVGPPGFTLDMTADDIARTLAATMADEPDKPEEDVEMEVGVIPDATMMEALTPPPSPAPPTPESNGRISDQYDLDMLREALRDRVVGVL